MRYILKNNAIVPVTVIYTDTQIISNPTDELIDEHAAGYPLQDNPMPEYDAETQHAPVPSWEFVDNVITRTWTITDFTEEELKEKRNAARYQRIEELNASLTTYKEEPIVYTNGKGYLPRWVQEFYSPAYHIGESICPMPVTAADGTSDTFTWEQFQDLYMFLLAASQQKVNEINAALLEVSQELE